MFSLCLSVHGGGGAPQSLVLGPFPASGPRFFLGGGVTPVSDLRSFPRGRGYDSQVLGQGTTPPPTRTRMEGVVPQLGPRSGYTLSPHRPGPGWRGGGTQSGPRSGHPLPPARTRTRGRWGGEGVSLSGPRSLTEHTTDRICRRRYASCVHTGGLSCSIGRTLLLWFNFYENWVPGQRKHCLWLFKNWRYFFKDWKVCQQLCNPHGREGLVRKLAQFEISNLNLEIVARVKQMLSGLQLIQVQAMSAGASTFFVWVSSCIWWNKNQYLNS